MVSQHIRPGFGPSDGGIAQRNAFEEVYCQQKAMENMGRVHRKLAHLSSAKRFLQQAGGSRYGNGIRATASRSRIT